MSESFDYIVVGGGTAGLVVAARLTEDTNVRVLVIEAGGDKRSDPALETPGLVAGAYQDDRFIWPFQSTPQVELHGRHLRQDTGKVLGGSSLTNFMMAMFPSRTNIDSWAKMGNKGWSYDDLAPYFKKFATSHPPSEAIKKTLGGLSYYQEDLKGDGPIQLSFDDQYSVMNEKWFKTFANLGLEMKTDPRTGRAIGAFQNSSTIESGKNTRSSSVTAYYTEEIARRPNLKVLLETTAQKIITEARNGQIVATSVVVKDKDGKASTLAANRESCRALATASSSRVSGSTL
ncbi:hypothetical protein NPX13_g7937 [Xylaria arbuscula]|uniref:Glucose-methanol-choline oxidoreductase N-terminal domain-containing protein n=1 Tax=Xylaria arbuscula TaxID=114810 RepID=A0A9W8TJX5_9PEZI|nr:hypothetical protein NPX13_g7937 [Xylaria arbuscula]